ncbi:hypothetical protein CRG98_033334 [Punica granatum]|uniref:Uncharacterized protein n=1 Tax=Punica granatum TaxID=22663 RepID=A0A2I0IQL0_PUNGR|nr:hypothetical protein CRG98_033334 [Punica granatum]
MRGGETVDEKPPLEGRGESIRQAAALGGDAATARCCHLIKRTVGLGRIESTCRSEELRPMTSPVAADLIRGGEGPTIGWELVIAIAHTALKTERRGRKAATIAETLSNTASTSDLRAKSWAKEPTVEEYAEEAAVEEPADVKELTVNAVDEETVGNWCMP